MRIASALAVLLAVTLLCSGCGTKPAATTPATTHAWVVDHVSITSDPKATETIYTAYCAPGGEFSPDTVTDPGALTPVAISENQFLWLRRGNACPGK